MIDELGPAERALLAAGRDALGPDAATVARMRVRVTAAVGAGAGTAAAAITATKLAVVATAAVAVAVGVGLYAQRAARVPATMPPPPQIAMTETEPDPAPRLAVVEREAPTLAPAAPPSVVVVAPPRVEPAPPPPPAPPQPASLTREIELVDQATAALRRGDAAAVLATIHSYDVETLGSGQLAEDAAAIAVEALCTSDDARAAGQLAAFLYRWPHSAQRARLTGACH